MTNERKSSKNSSCEPKVREFTIDFYMCLIMDVWPSPAQVIDFGIASEAHYAALHYAVGDAVGGGVTPEQLDDALGKGPALTALIRPGNPYYGRVEFKTDWDELLPEPDED